MSDQLILALWSFKIMVIKSQEFRISKKSFVGGSLKMVIVHSIEKRLTSKLNGSVNILMDCGPNLTGKVYCENRLCYRRPF